MSAAPDLTARIANLEQLVLRQNEALMRLLGGAHYPEERERRRELDRLAQGVVRATE